MRIVRVVSPETSMMFPTNVACESEINTVRNTTYRWENGIYDVEIMAVQGVPGLRPVPDQLVLDHRLTQLPDRHWSNRMGSSI
jgi:hypothetical protein